jgi:flagellar basal-body rod modification protein FlgD
MPTVSPPGSVISTLPSDPSLRLPARTLGQADFLKLLATQMSAQDPLNPQSDTNFIAQMAQFSSLQANTSMQQALAQMQATGLLGQTVSLQIDSVTAPVQGVVSAVQMVNGTPKIVVNGSNYDLSQVISVSPTVAANASPTGHSKTAPTGTSTVNH